MLSKLFLQNVKKILYYNFQKTIFEGKNVHLSFVTFELEDEQDCGYDFIEVFSGFDDTGPSYGRFCGNKVLGSNPAESVQIKTAAKLTSLGLPITKHCQLALS